MIKGPNYPKSTDFSLQCYWMNISDEWIDTEHAASIGRVKGQVAWTHLTMRYCSSNIVKLTKKFILILPTLLFHFIRILVCQVKEPCVRSPHMRAVDGGRLSCGGCSEVGKTSKRRRNPLKCLVTLLATGKWLSSLMYMSHQEVKNWWEWEEC